MKKRKTLNPVLLIHLLVFTLVLSAKSEAKEPWISLFNGQNLGGWSIVGSDAKAWVEDSAIVCHMVCNTPEHTFVRTNGKYGDFIFETDCKLDGDFHTGILLRCIETPDTASVSLYGYQIKIDPTPRKWTGGVFDDFGKSWHWWYTLANDEGARNAFIMNEWNHFRVEAIGKHIKVWINGIPTCNMLNSKYTNGYIAFKIHAMGNFPEKEKILVHYKNIRIITNHPGKYTREMDIEAKEFAN